MLIKLFSIIPYRFLLNLFLIFSILQKNEGNNQCKTDQIEFSSNDIQEISDKPVTSQNS